MNAPALPFTFTSSFDDGHEDDLIVAEALARRGAKATFYVAMNRGFGAPEISAASARKLVAMGMEVGSHSASHKPLVGKPYADVVEDLTAGKKGVEDMIGAPVVSLSYPEGIYDAGVVRAAAEAGFKVARTTVAFRTAPTGDPLRLPITFEFERKSAYRHARHAARDGNVYGLLRWALDAGLATDPVAASRAFVAAAARRGGFVHLRTRSWEVVKNGLLEPLDAAVAAACAVPGVRHATNAEVALA
jgi:peptidoglycan/xylan/chitin deacetylase (PgdA/CDA1 family)